MALLQLKDIGKIYVSEGNVTVGIRGVNLSFDRGEFVAVTGASGSGKSTLLNVISGMDSYEEGELFIEGCPTSHYSQTDWEIYRQNYISFVFQDYNIIDSFTVLQNVELALMDIEDRKERRRRAVDLLRRVGLGDRLHQKGSKLSGGQKQRTVIARALAKDSPIILADEPTGNLDSETAKEIVALLREVSRDKLLIMVTHNYEQVEDTATRLIRVYDGAVEADTLLRDAAVPAEPASRPAGSAAGKPRYFRDGLTLGGAVFCAKPMLSFFLILFLTVGALGIFAVTSLFDFSSLFDKSYMFTPREGRVIVSTRDGKAPSQEKIGELARLTGAENYLLFDYPLDMGERMYSFSFPDSPEIRSRLRFTYGEFPERLSVGRLPEKDSEVLLLLPIGDSAFWGSDEILHPCMILQGGEGKNPPMFRVTGISYLYDNTQPSRIVFTEAGFFALCEKLQADRPDYSQFSLLFDSDDEARAAVRTLHDQAGDYVAVMSSETYVPNAAEVIMDSLLNVGLVVLWVLSILFLAFFIHLCTGRSVQSFRDDMAILRSMGIPVRTVKISVYVRMFLAMIPAVLAVFLAAFLIFRSPKANPNFTYLPWWGYLLIVLGMILLTWRITARQMKKLFSESVRKNLAGGDAQ